MLEDDVVVRFNESLRDFSLAVKEMTDAGYSIEFEFKKNRLEISRDGQPVNTMFVDNPEQTA